MPPLYLVTKRMPHHKTRAGYNQLVRHLDADAVVTAPSGRLWRMAGAATRRLWKPFTRTAWYGAPSLVAELELALRARRAPGVVHVMYGEDLLLATGRIDPRHKVIATFHQPPERFDALVRTPRVWSQLDAVIVLDDHNEAVWSARVPRVFRLTLGVDVDYWRPGGARGRHVLTVGNHLRDFDLLLAAVARRPDLEFDLVIPEAVGRRFAGYDHVRCHHDISDASLLELFQSAGVLFLPLRGGSASNTVLQALACGLGVVTSAYAGASTYLDDAVARFAPAGALDAHLDALDAALADPVDPAIARARAETMSWAAVAERHREVYAAVAR
ncbi:MAG: glycosyltransferase [Deltaproteobacteria bacterium]